MQKQLKDYLLPKLFLGQVQISTSIAAIKLLRQELGNNLSGNKISIIGLGAIGFQLSLSLIREGVTINCYTKDYTKGLIKANAINTIKVITP